jgi:hypothetical protein
MSKVDPFVLKKLAIWTYAATLILFLLILVTIIVLPADDSSGEAWEGFLSAVGLIFFVPATVVSLILVVIGLRQSILGTISSVLAIAANSVVVAFMVYFLILEAMAGGSL